MQDVFRFHDTERFEIFMYSLEESDGSVEVEAIRNSVSSCGGWKVLRGTTRKMARMIQADDLDIIVDLCGYTGTSVVAEIMAQRVAAPVQVSYMGYPGSSGAPYIDWMIADATVISSDLRPHYTESILFMPHCYFVNSHQFLTNSQNDKSAERTDYNLPKLPAFVFCCHSRPDKIDPMTFATWIRALERTRRLGEELQRDDMINAVLWLLRSDPVMEDNLRSTAKIIWSNSDSTLPYPEDGLVFCDKAPRQEHLQRLQLADVFLDTPAYNAHTVGCDCLSAGVPMISLLQDEATSRHKTEDTRIYTDKLASRVGASLLKSVEGSLFDRLVVSSMKEYEDCMVDCARDGLVKERQHLLDTSKTAPLWDTERWVKNLETGLKEMVSLFENHVTDTDIYVLDD
jgi:protein O-GlcNAc transferase